MENQKKEESEAKPVFAKKGQFKVKKQTNDRRIRQKAKTYDDNMYLKMEGKDVPDTRRQKKTEYPVSPAVLLLCLFLVVGSAFLQMLNTYNQGQQTVE